MKTQAIFASLTLLAACGGGGTSPTTQPAEPYIITSAAQLFTATAVDTGTIGQTNTGISVDDPDNLDTGTVQIDGVPVDVTYQPDETWESADGTTRAILTRSIAGEPETGEVYFLRFEQTSGGSTSYYALADGFGKSDPPASGSASYSGSVVMFDPSGGEGTGTIDLSMDFDAANNGLSGTLNGGFPDAPTASFDLVATDVPGQSEKFQTTLTSTDVTVTDSVIGGQFFDTDGARMIGDFAIATTGSSAVGFFDADVD